MIGIQLYTVRALLENEAAADKTIAALGKMGYECIQLFGGTTNLDMMRWCVNAARKYGLKVIGILSNPISLRESFNEITEIAREAGCSDIGISPPCPPTPRSSIRAEAPRSWRRILCEPSPSAPI